MAFVESERGRWRVARSVRPYASTLDAEIARLSAKAPSHLSEDALDVRLGGAGRVQAAHAGEDERLVSIVKHGDVER